MASGAPAASIIVPAYREQANIKLLTDRIFAAVGRAGIEAELIIVDDDSKDGTEELVKVLASEYPVRLIVRTGQRGLSSAVLAGFRDARFDRFVVLDADLQHPPEAIPELLTCLDRDDCDFAVATRYGQGGRIAGTWPFHRRIASRIATLLARPLVSISDPMSGFFAIRRETWERADAVNPVGYKIALELFVKGRCCSPAEVPISFAVRAHGASKFGLSQQCAFIVHLITLYWFRYRRYAVGGLVVGAAALAWLLRAYARR